MGWFSIFSTAALDFSFLEFSKSVTIYFLPSFQAFKFKSFPEQNILKLHLNKKKYSILNTFISLISKFLIYFNASFNEFVLVKGAPVAVSNA